MVRNHLVVKNITETFRVCQHVYVYIYMTNFMRFNRTHITP